MKAKSVSAILVIILAVIAFAVSIWQFCLADVSRAECWMLIVIYWGVLTIKNICDLIASSGGKKEESK